MQSNVEFNRKISVFVFLHLWLVTLLMFRSDVWKECLLLWDKMKVWSFIFVPVAQREIVAEVRLQESQDDYVSQRRDEDKKGIGKASRLEGGTI